jgi:hypothetical protein
MHPGRREANTSGCAWRRTAACASEKRYPRPVQEALRALTSSSSVSTCLGGRLPEHATRTTTTGRGFPPSPRPRRRTHSSGTRRSSTYPLSGLLRCARCGSSVSGERRPVDRERPRERHVYSCYKREERQRRLNEMYELGRIDHGEYTARCAELDEQKLAATHARTQPVFVRQRTTLRTLVDRWSETPHATGGLEVVGSGGCSAGNADPRGP